MNDIYWWSDPHFSHKSIIDFCERPFKNIQDMNDKLIENYNSVVKPGDVCVWVGDCFFCGARKAKEIMEALNGRKILVLGNHDGSDVKMLNLGFEFIAKTFMSRYKSSLIQVSHYPFKPSMFSHLKMSFANRYLAQKNDLRFIKRRPIDKGQFLIHGHTHQKKTFVGRSIHVGVDSNNYIPVKESLIKEYINDYKGN